MGFRSRFERRLAQATRFSGWIGLSTVTSGTSTYTVTSPQAAVIYHLEMSGATWFHSAAAARTVIRQQIHIRDESFTDYLHAYGYGAAANGDDASFIIPQHRIEYPDGLVLLEGDDLVFESVLSLRGSTTTPQSIESRMTFALYGERIDV